MEGGDTHPSARSDGSVPSPSPSSGRRRTASPASSRFASGTASSRSRNTAIASSLTQPIPAHRYSESEPSSPPLVPAEGLPSGSYTFPRTPAASSSSTALPTRAQDVRETPKRSSVTTPRRSPSSSPSHPRARTPRLLSPAQRRAQRRESVQELIHIADAAAVAIKSPHHARRGDANADSPSSSSSAPMPQRSSGPAGPTTRASLLETEIEDALRGRHRHSVVVVPEEAKAQFDDVLRVSPVLGPRARGDGAPLVTEAIDYAIDVYRELHHRTFHSKSEELTFLRRDYVSLRKTLMLLYDENARLKNRLRERTDEVGQLQARVDICEHYHKSAESASGMESDNEARSASASRKPAGRPSASATAAAAAAAAKKKRTAPGKASVGRRSPAAAATAAAGGEVGEEEGEQEGEHATPTSSSLWLHAAAQKAARQITVRNKGTKANVNDLNTVELINELRRNLARRDTQLDALRLESTDFSRARNVLEKELGEAREALRAITHDRNRLLQVVEDKDNAVDALTTRNSALEKDLSEKTQQLGALTSEVEKWRLLQGRPSISTAAVVSEGVSEGSPDVQRLRDEARDYRQRWQAAEDRIDQLVHAARASTGSTASARTPPSPSAPPVADDVRQRLERELSQQADELHRLHRRLEREQEAAQFRESQQRQQAQDQSRLHQTELAAVQAQLQAARAQLEREGHDRDALVRQLRQTSDQDALTQVLQSQLDTLKQRLSEVSGQLSEVRGREQALQLEVQKAQHAKLLLTRSQEAAEAALRRAQQDESLRGEELALLRTSLGTSEGKVYALEQMIAALQKRAWRSGEDEASGPRATSSASKTETAEVTRYCHCDDHAQASPSTSLPPPPSTTTPTTAVSAEALASDLKGYASLMEFNAALTDRLNQLESALANATRSLDEQQQQHVQEPHGEHEQEQDSQEEVASTARTTMPPAPEPFLNEELVRQRYVVLTELHALQHDLQLSQRAQQTLLVQWQDLRQRHDELEEDNLILAEGTAIIHDELVALLTEKAARQEAAIKALHTSPPPPSPSASTQTDRTATTTNRTETASKHVQVDVCTSDAEGTRVRVSAPPSRRVRYLRGEVEAARYPRSRSHLNSSSDEEEEERDDQIHALSAENRSLARRLRHAQKRLLARQAELAEKQSALDKARRELDEYEELIRLLDEGAIDDGSGRGRLWESVLLRHTAGSRSRSMTPRRGGSTSWRRARDRHPHHLDVAFETSTHSCASSFSACSDDAPPSQGLRHAGDSSCRRRAPSRPTSAHRDASWSSSEEVEEDGTGMADWHERRGARQKWSARVRSGTRAASRSRRAGAWRRQRTPPPLPSAQTISTEVELYAVHCHAHRDKDGVVREKWSAVPLTGAATTTTTEAAAADDDALASDAQAEKAAGKPPVASASTTTKRKEKKKGGTSRSSVCRPKGEVCVSGTPRSTRSTSSTVTSAVSAAVLVPQ